ncbi:hypothetical protein PPN31114_03708 [Pandoraea pneumonica]|uniref:Uncharacterized protein n=1 Tax=Pandoraea pneumonica TaxID=2508299 RepID=A0A5E4X6F5_9BURK|nr:hypothetical protein PPN31114_03708 [Pandoraea pneumonica]
MLPYQEKPATKAGRARRHYAKIIRDFAALRHARETLVSECLQSPGEPYRLTMTSE